MKHGEPNSKKSRKRRALKRRMEQQRPTSSPPKKMEVKQVARTESRIKEIIRQNTQTGEAQQCTRS